MNTTNNLNLQQLELEKLLQRIHKTPVGAFMEHWDVTESDLNDIRSFVKKGDFDKVGLQFPNELLDRSVRITKQLDGTLGKCTIAILADTSFGSCCVDEVAGQHYSVDAIVHFGPACLSSAASSSQIPVKYVIGRIAINPDSLRTAFLPLRSSERIILFYDFVFLDSVRPVGSDLPSCVFSFPNLPEFVTSSESGSVICGRFLPGISEDEDLSNAILVYVGWNDLCLTNIMFSLPSCKDYFLFDVEILEMKSLDRHREMRRRMLLIEKASAAERVGLLVGTLGGSGRYMAMLDRLRAIVRGANKRCYTLMVGKLNPMKLQNFANLDCFVLVACPQNSLFDIKKSKEDYSIFQPIVTPYEMEQACLPPEKRVWNMTFVSDFEDLLKLAEKEEDTRSATSSDKTIVLAPNKMLAERNPELAVSSHLPQRAVEEGHTWFGLEPSVGQTPVTAPKPGRRGIAIEYEEEIK